MFFFSVKVIPVLKTPCVLGFSVKVVPVLKIIFYKTTNMKNADYIYLVTPAYFFLFLLLESIKITLTQLVCLGKLFCSLTSFPFSFITGGWYLYWLYAERVRCEATKTLWWGYSWGLYTVLLQAHVVPWVYGEMVCQSTRSAETWNMAKQQITLSNMQGCVLYVGYM